jgi:hypothetical protein
MLKRNLLVATAIVVMSSSAAFAGSTSQHHQRSHYSLYEHRMSYTEPAYAYGRPHRSALYYGVGLRGDDGGAIYDNTDLNYGGGYLSGHDALVETL